MAAAAILKIAFLAITHRPIVRFQRNFIRGSRTACRQGLHDKNCIFFKIQAGGRPLFWKSLNRHISVKNRPILMKFGTLHQILNPVTDTWPKLKLLKFKMAAAAILKIAFLAITHRPIVRFQRNFVRGSRTACRQGLWDNKCKRVKSQMADGRHFANRKIAISQWKSSDFDEIWYTTLDIEPGYSHVTKNWNF